MGIDYRNCEICCDIYHEDDVLYCSAFIIPKTNTDFKKLIKAKKESLYITTDDDERNIVDNNGNIILNKKSYSWNNISTIKICRFCLPKDSSDIMEEIILIPAGFTVKRRTIEKEIISFQKK